jgi:ABC-type multidrug transport system fused ATPase/permease subunit
MLSGSRRIMLFVGVLSAFCAGLLFPSIAVIMGEVLSNFDPANATNVDELMRQLLLTILLISSILWICGYLFYAFMQHIAETIAIELRGKYLRALMIQEVEFFERNHVESMPSDIGQYFNTISLGIGESYAQMV